MLDTIVELIALCETEYAERTAFQWLDEESGEVRSVTFSRFADDVRRCAGALGRELGSLAHTHVALLARNSYPYAVWLLAVMLSGGVAIPLNFEKEREEIAYELSHAEAEVLLHDGGYFQREGGAEGLFSGRLLPMGESFTGEPLETAPLCSADELRMLLFTSGTTGRSKAVMLSEKAILSVVESDIQLSDTAQRGIGEDPKAHISELLILPLYHVAGLNRLFVRLAGGNTLNLCGDLSAFYRDVVALPTDYVLTVPVIFKSLYRDVLRGRKKKLGQVRTVVSAGAMLDGEQLRVMVENGYFVMNCYGMTELFSGGTRNSSQEERYLNSIGRCSELFQCKAIDGELCFRGDGVMLGYYRDEAATREVLDADGWLHTGDLAEIDGDGYVYLTGRKKNLIILASGENVSPEELEEKLLRCEAVRETVVKELEGRIAAEVYCEKEDCEAVRQYADELNLTLPLYKRIGTLLFRDTAFERTASGKIKRES